MGNRGSTTQAARDDVQIFTADTFYKFTTYMDKVHESRKTDRKEEAVFPVILQIDKLYVFHKCDPIVVGCQVMGGQLRVGTPLCLPDKDNLSIGRVGSIEKDRKPTKIAR